MRRLSTLVLAALFVLGAADPIRSQSFELLHNGGFESGLSDWAQSDGGTGYDVDFSAESGASDSGLSFARVAVNSVPASPGAWKVRLQQGGLAVDQHERYLVRMALRAGDGNSKVTVCLQKNSSPYTVYEAHVFQIDQDWRSVEYEFVSPVTTSSDLRIVYWLGANVGTIDIDSVSVAWLPNAVHAIGGEDWSDVGFSGEIPLRPVSVDASTLGLVGDGVTDDGAVIQSALDQAVPGSSVYLPDGNYLVGRRLNIPDHVTLCGESPTGTVLRFDLSDSSEIPIVISRWDRGDYVDVLGDHGRGSRTLSVQDASSFLVGQHLELEQENDPERMYTSSDWDVPWAQNSVGEIARVVSIDGNQLQLDRPLEHDYHAWRLPKVRRFRAIEGAGIESLKIVRIDAGVSTTILIKHAVDCFVRNIEMDHTVVAHIWISISTNCEVRSSHIHHSHDYGGGGRGYGVVCGQHATRCLIEDNVFDTLRHAMMVKEGAASNAFVDNYSRNPTWTASGTPADICFHGHFPTHNLFEGNVAQNAIHADYYGPSGPGNVLFRNRIESEAPSVRDHSDHQVLVGNEFEFGPVQQQHGVFDTRHHTNESPAGLDVAWPGFLPDSMIRFDAPSHFDGFDWPAIGPDILGSVLPAQARFEDGSQIVPILPPLAPLNLHARVETDPVDRFSTRFASTRSEDPHCRLRCPPTDRSVRRQLRKQRRAERRKLRAAVRPRTWERYEAALERMSELDGAIAQIEARERRERSRRLLEKVRRGRLRRR
ncbi:MAG: glycosyl hydrolase family 28-related protein [Planctomycetota bacterium]